MTKRIDKIINPLYEWSANFSQNICKELVHKSFNSEVFLTDSYKTSNNSFLVSAFLPKTHIYYNDIPDSLAYRHDVSLLLILKFILNLFVNLKIKIFVLLKKNL